MHEPVRDSEAMIAAMAPELRPGLFVFCTLADRALAAAALDRAVATVTEAEGLSLVLPVEDARALDFDCAMPMRQITLTVHSALDGVGLTAAVAGALAGRAIPCNMVAGFHHDHVFVPEEMADRAMDALKELQSGVR